MKDFLRKAFGVYVMIFAILIPILFYGLAFDIKTIYNIIGVFIVGSVLLIALIALFCIGLECLKD